MNRTTYLHLALAFVVLSSSLSHADRRQRGTEPVPVSVSSSSGEVVGTDNLSGACSFDDDQLLVSVNIASATPFAGIDLSAASAGQTFSVSSGEAFDAAVAQITNGESDMVSVSFACGAAGGEVDVNESAVFSPYSPDLAGMPVSELSLIVNSASASSAFDVSLGVGIAPEPASSILAWVAGLAGLLIRRRRA